MKNLKLLAALLALAIGLAGCGNGSSTPSSKPEKMLDGDNMIAPNTQKQEYEEPEDVTYNAPSGRGGRIPGLRAVSGRLL